MSYIPGLAGYLINDLFFASQPPYPKLPSIDLTTWSPTGDQYEDLDAPTKDRKSTFNAHELI